MLSHAHPKVDHLVTVLVHTHTAECRTHPTGVDNCDLTVLGVTFVALHGGLIQMTPKSS